MHQGEDSNITYQVICRAKLSTLRFLWPYSSPSSPSPSSTSSASSPSLWTNIPTDSFSFNLGRRSLICLDDDGILLRSFKLFAQHHDRCVLSADFPGFSLPKMRIGSRRFQILITVWLTSKSLLVLKYCKFQYDS